jgi:hypothetical protein
MPITPEQFVAKFLEVQDGLIRDYFAGGIKAAALCHVMHHESPRAGRRRGHGRDA